MNYGESEMIEIKLPESDKVSIVGVTVKVRCKSCGSSFGVYLDSKYQLPFNYDFCFRCEGKKKYVASKKEIKENGKEVDLLAKSS